MNKYKLIYKPVFFKSKKNVAIKGTTAITAQIEKIDKKCKNGKCIIGNLGRCIICERK